MCSIIGSFNKEVIEYLVNENKYRGEFSFSITKVDPETYTTETYKKFCKFDNNYFNQVYEKRFYYLIHMQAPTIGLVKDPDRIHPIKYNDYKLLHNGVLKQKWVDKQKKKDKIDSNFDTLHLITYLANTDLPLQKALEEIDGSYVCVLIKEKKFIKVFRNDSSIIHYKGTDLSSHKVKGMKSLPSFKIFNLDLKNRELKEESDFNSINKPFFFTN